MYNQPGAKFHRYVTYTLNTVSALHPLKLSQLNSDQNYFGRNSEHDVQDKTCKQSAGNFTSLLSS